MLRKEVGESEVIHVGKIMGNLKNLKAMTLLLKASATEKLVILDRLRVGWRVAWCARA